MEVGQGPTGGCSAIRKKEILNVRVLAEEIIIVFNFCILFVYIVF
jgi:hypothetical protein